jgi:hypothetical protein
VHVLDGDIHVRVIAALFASIRPADVVAHVVINRNKVESPFDHLFLLVSELRKSLSNSIFHDLRVVAQNKRVCVPFHHENVVSFSGVFILLILRVSWETVADVQHNADFSAIFSVSENFDCFCVGEDHVVGHCIHILVLRGAKNCDYPRLVESVPVLDVLAEIIETNFSKSSE